MQTCGFLASRTTLEKPHGQAILILSVVYIYAGSYLLLSAVAPGWGWTTRRREGRAHFRLSEIPPFCGNLPLTLY